MTHVVFYDNHDASPLPDRPNLVEFERVYSLYFDRFTESDWDALAAIYRTLPGEYRANPLPYWFGDSDESEVYVWASVEPPGLQVSGVLEPAQWSAWDSAFRDALKRSTLPFRALDGPPPPDGSVVVGVVESVHPFGFFVALPDGDSGLVRAPWISDVQPLPSEAIPEPGATVTCVVLGSAEGPNGYKIALSMRPSDLARATSKTRP